MGYLSVLESKQLAYHTINCIKVKQVKRNWDENIIWTRYTQSMVSVFQLNFQLTKTSIGLSLFNELLEPVGKRLQVVLRFLLLVVNEK